MRVLKSTARRSPPIPASTPQDAELDFIPRTVWEHRLQELLDFRRVNGHVNVPRRWSQNLKLANWVSNQRRLLRLGLLGQERLRKLALFRISWEGKDARREAQQETWNRMFGALKTFKRRSGHLQVPKGWTGDPGLGAWLISQRYLWRKGLLPEGRSSRLEELDADWHRSGARPKAATKRPKARDRREAAWELRFSALMEYRRRHGHCGVPARCAEDRELAQWVLQQRGQRRRGRLSEERIGRLEALGFVWSGRDLLRSQRDKVWEARFRELQSFARTHGSPELLKGALFQWLSDQRRRRRRGLLAPERERRLESAGVVWSVREGRWEARVAELLAWRDRHGDCAVTTGGAADRALSRWVSAQRTAKKSGRLSASRIHRLEKVGFLWAAPKAVPSHP